MKNIKAIIFDMDGVLVDSEPIHEKAEIQTCREFGIDTSNVDWNKFRGIKLKDIFSQVSKEYGKGDEPIEKMMERKVKIYLENALQNIKLIVGVQDFLDKLKSTQKFSYALTTSGIKVQQDKILDRFGLTGFFPIMITSDDVVKGKPDPEPYTKTVEKLGELPENCLVIEDSKNGVLSAKAAGCQVCGIENRFFSREQLKEAGADLVITEFGELEKILFE